MKTNATTGDVSQLTLTVVFYFRDTPGGWSWAKQQASHVVGNLVYNCPHADILLNDATTGLTGGDIMRVA